PQDRPDARPQEAPSEIAQPVAAARDRAIGESAGDCGYQAVESIFRALAGRALLPAAHERLTTATMRSSAVGSIMNSAGTATISASSIFTASFSVVMMASAPASRAARLMSATSAGV